MTKGTIVQQRYLSTAVGLSLLLTIVFGAFITHPQPTIAADNRMYGVNLEYVEDWRPGMMFSDLLKQSRGWDRVSGGPAAVDAQGWPTEDAQSILVIGESSWALGGTYTISFNGQATISAAVGSFAVRNQSYNAGTNLTTAEVAVPDGTAEIWLRLTNTRRTNTASTNTGVTNVTFIRPGYAADGSQVFGNEFLTAISRFQLFRTMNAVNTNDNTPNYPDQTEWNERKTPDYATQTANNVAGSVEKTGVAWEYLIQLANQTDSDIWVNIPVSASDSYITNLARLLRDGNAATAPLKPNLKLYVEWSNEIWNGQFPSRNYQIALARAQGVDDFELVSKRTVEISNIFRGVFGASAINQQVRVLLPGQIANIGTYRPDYIAQNYGPVSNYIYGIAGAPYFNAGTVNTSGSVDQILAAMSASINGEGRSQKLDIINLAKQYGIKALCYEGGPDNGGGDQANVPNRIAANFDVRITEMMVRDVTSQWWDLGGDVFMQYKLASRYDKNGMWGVSTRHNALDGVKWDAVAQITGQQPTTSTPTPATPTTPPTGGTGSGLRGEYFTNITLNGSPALVRTDANVDNGWGLGGPGSPIGNDNFSVRWSGQVEAPVGGSYSFITTSDDGVRLWVNGQQVIYNWTDHGPTDDTGAITLNAGQRYTITMEFYERGGGAVARLQWAYPGQSQQVIPQARLYPASGGTPTVRPVPPTLTPMPPTPTPSNTLTTITFEDATSGTTSYAAGGFTITETRGEQIMIYGSAAGYASAVAQPQNWRGGLRIVRSDAASFTLSSFDYAASRWNDAGDATVTGTRSDGITVTRTYSFSSKSLTTLPLNWSNLIKVEVNFDGGVNQAYGAIDNISVR